MQPRRRFAAALSLGWLLFFVSLFLVALFFASLPARADPPLDGGPLPSTVSVRVLSKQKPRRLEVMGGGSRAGVLIKQKQRRLGGMEGERRTITAVGDQVAEGSRRSPSLALPSGRWILSVEGIRRTYVGALSIGARDGELEILLQIHLEEYVAQVVAAETVAGTVAATLRAQAIVSRSYALAARERSRLGRGRHRVGDLCDLAHCQVIRGIHHGAHGRSARRAAEQTVGQILVVSDSPDSHPGSGPDQRGPRGLDARDSLRGRVDLAPPGTDRGEPIDPGNPRARVYEAPFHASCGGHTADPLELFGGEGGGARAVADLGCTQREWETIVPASVVEDSVRALSGASSPPGVLRLVRGRGGFVVRIEDPMSGRRISGDAFVREVDRRMGWGHVRSARFNWEHRGSFVRFSGSGIGHGVGLCQQGARRMGEAGASHAEILQRYYPDASLIGVARP